MTLLADRQNSQSPSRRLSLSDKISALGAKISRSLSTIDPSLQDEDRDSVVSDLPMINGQQKDRSLSRGRDAFQSTGRGGLGNIRQASLSRDARPDSGPDDFSTTRGREPVPGAHKDVYSTGRGGVGNLRSPSRDASRPPAVPDIAEQEALENYAATHQDVVHSTGRGGAGNFNRSRSRDPAGNAGNFDRSRSRDPAAHPVHSTGRGGAGNIKSGAGLETDSIDETERRKHGHHPEGYHSTGRGGAANLTATSEPAVEHHQHHAHGFESTGRGGAGNIVHD